MPTCAQGMKWSKKLGRCVDPTKVNPKTGQRRGGGGGGAAEGTYEIGDEDNVFIGVPSDYRAVGQGRWKPVKRGAPTWGHRGGRPQGMPTHTEKPIYKEGGEFRQLAGYSPDAIFQIQVDLVDLGLLEEEGWIPGVNDPKTAAAFKKVLATANTQAREWQDVLPEMLSNVEAAGGLGGPGGEGEVTLPPFAFQPTNPEDLAADLTGVAGGDGQAWGTIGRGASDAEKMQFASEYNAQELGSQKAQYDAETAAMLEEAAGGPGGGQVTLNQPPSSQVAAEEWLKRRNPGEYIATRAARNAQVFYDLLENSNWRLSSG